MNYVYLLETVHGPPETYQGRTADLRTRLADHNAGSWPK
jgi:predicted GIY-YIG superfamily endonuclease